MANEYDEKCTDISTKAHNEKYHKERTYTSVNTGQLNEERRQRQHQHYHNDNGYDECTDTTTPATAEYNNKRANKSMNTSQSNDERRDRQRKPSAAKYNRRTTTPTPALPQ